MQVHRQTSRVDDAANDPRRAEGQSIFRKSSTRTSNPRQPPSPATTPPYTRIHIYHSQQNGSDSSDGLEGPFYQLPHPPPNPLRLQNRPIHSKSHALATTHSIHTHNLARLLHNPQQIARPPGHNPYALFNQASDTLSRGGLAERPKAHDWKSCWVNSPHGFESRILRWSSEPGAASTRLRCFSRGNRSRAPQLLARELREARLLRNPNLRRTWRNTSSIAIWNGL